MGSNRGRTECSRTTGMPGSCKAELSHLMAGGGHAQELLRPLSGGPDAVASQAQHLRAAAGQVVGRGAGIILWDWHSSLLRNRGGVST